MKYLMATFLAGCTIFFSSYSKEILVNEVRIISSWETVGDTAIIRVPMMKERISSAGGTIEHRDLKSVMGDFVAGDRVTIKMKYTGLHNTYEYEEFKGFIKYISPKTPVEIECEDAVYLLKRVNLEKSWRATTLREVVNYIVQETNKVNDYKITLSGKIPDVKFDKFRLNNCNGAEALQKIKEEFGLVAYFNDLTLFVGLAFTELVGTVKYNLSWNIISNDLTYLKAEDRKIRLKAVSLLKDNKQLSVEVGDKSGELRTQFYHNISDKATLEKLAKTDISKLKFEGYEGSIETFLIPYARHSMTAEITDPEFNNRQGNYIIDEVETSFSREGIRRKVTIGKRI